MFDISLSEPYLHGNEWQYVKECLDTEWVSSSGKYVELFENNISKYTGSKYAVSCINGTSALQVSLRLAGVQPGDEVIVPTLTFIAPVNAIVYNGASPVFMDADKYYNLDTEKTIEFIKKETIFKDGCTYNKKTNNRISSIIPVHVWGNAVFLNELVVLCRERNISIVEDACESMGTVYKTQELYNKHTGTIGKLGCLSFNGNKIMTTGGGGMILTDDKMLADKARYLTTQAKDNSVRYIHNEIGYNYRLTNIQAALGVAQLEQLPEHLELKRKIFHHYQTGLEGIDGITLISGPEYAENNHWLNLLHIDSKIYGEDREALMCRLGSKSIQTRPVWALNNQQKPYRNCQSYQVEEARQLVNNSLCLPSSTSLSDDDLNKVIGYLNE